MHRLPSVKEYSPLSITTANSSSVHINASFSLDGLPSSASTSNSLSTLVSRGISPQQFSEPVPSATSACLFVLRGIVCCRCRRVFFPQAIHVSYTGLVQAFKPLLSRFAGVFRLVHADPSPSEFFRCNQGRSAAAKRIQNQIPLVAGCLDHALEKVNRLLRRISRYLSYD